LIEKRVYEIHEKFSKIIYFFRYQKPVPDSSNFFVADTFCMQSKMRYQDFITGNE